MTSNQKLKQWIEEVSELTQPDNIHWCTGSDEENAQFQKAMLKTGEFLELNQKTHPGCYLHRSDPTDVARVEHLTFICTENEADAEAPEGGRFGVSSNTGTGVFDGVVQRSGLFQRLLHVVGCHRLIPAGRFGCHRQFLLEWWE